MKEDLKIVQNVDDHREDRLNFTPVTIENFMAWKTKFEEELAITENLKRLNSKHSAIIKES